jgi:hypothetical protein
MNCSCISSWKNACFLLKRVQGQVTRHHRLGKHPKIPKAPRRLRNRGDSGINEGEKPAVSDLETSQENYWGPRQGWVRLSRLLCNKHVTTDVGSVQRLQQVWIGPSSATSSTQRAKSAFLTLKISESEKLNQRHHQHTERFLQFKNVLGLPVYSGTTATCCAHSDKQRKI